MFSRVGRLTTFGAHAISNCPFRRDKNYLPQRAQASALGHNSDGYINFAHHTFSNTIRQRTTSDSSTSNADPFLGVLSNDEREVIKELELLDLDSWNGANPIAGSLQNPEIPSGSEGISNTQNDYQMTSSSWTNNPRFGCDELCNDDFEDWTSVVREHDQNVAHQHQNLHQQNQPQDQNQHQFYTTTNNNQPPLGFNAPKFENLKNFENDIDNASKLVDWDAWSRYLAEDDQIISGCGAPVAPSPAPQQMDSTSYVNYLSAVPKLETSTPILRFEDEIKQEQDFELQNYEPSFGRNAISTNPDYDLNLFQSGPLTYIPKSEEDDCKSLASSSSSRKLRTSRRTYRSTESERSWTPASDDYYNEEKPKFKKRGVVVKPSVDEETDRRRALNRVAAIRYREKKREEKMARNRDYQEVLQRNKMLRQQEKQLSKEISELKKKMKKYENHH
ncbi:unnamed protein product [Caenorhabditis angaria]|uniref:BZIP domain-containing protein n=1 Tax=Caenorhabditis angaria TaxID=860376 RepID=A0A9P1N5L7_9PELO|nr:unnamed protein product [Caenorhabditis angaria]